jgi:hypothetical protein
MTLIFENCCFYIKISDSLRLKIPDEESKKYYNIEDVEDEFYYINAYISYVIKNYKDFPMLFMSLEGNIVLGNRILSSTGIDYVSRVKEIMYNFSGSEN